VARPAAGVAGGIGAGVATAGVAVVAGGRLVLGQFGIQRTIPQG